MDNEAHMRTRDQTQLAILVGQTHRPDDSPGCLRSAAVAGSARL